MDKLDLHIAIDVDVRLLLGEMYYTLRNDISLEYASLPRLDQAIVANAAQKYSKAHNVDFGDALIMIALVKERNRQSLKEIGALCDATKRYE